MTFSNVKYVLSVQAPGATTSPQNAADKKVNDGLKVAMNAFRQFLVVTNAATPVFTPLQSVAGGLLAVIDTLQVRRSVHPARGHDIS